MDPHLPQSVKQHEDEEDGDWDTDGFVIPSLTIGDSELVGGSDTQVRSDTKPPETAMKKEKIYLGPHGAPRSQTKHQDLNPFGNKQRFKNKLKEADRKYSGYDRENKVEAIQQLVGEKVSNGTMQKSSAGDWLDPHCHENELS